MLTTRNGQSVFDIALQTKGDVSKAVELADQNEVNVTDTLAAGTELDVTPQPENTVVRNYQEKGIYPGTLAEPEGGLGYMGVGLEFNVH